MTYKKALEPSSPSKSKNSLDKCNLCQKKMIYSTSFSQPSSDKHGDEEGITSVVGGSSKQIDLFGVGDRLGGC